MINPENSSSIPSAPRPRRPINPIVVSTWRREGGTGEPAAHPVPPSKNAPGLTNTSPFRVGPGGLVVVIVPEELKAACARRGWSLTDLAKRAGISYPTLRSTLRGNAIRPRTGWKLARALGEGNAPTEFDRLLQAT